MSELTRHPPIAPAAHTTASYMCRSLKVLPSNRSNCVMGWNWAKGLKTAASAEAFLAELHSANCILTVPQTPEWSHLDFFALKTWPKPRSLSAYRTSGQAIGNQSKPALGISRIRQVSYDIRTQKTTALYLAFCHSLFQRTNNENTFSIQRSIIHSTFDWFRFTI